MRSTGIILCLASAAAFGAMAAFGRLAYDNGATVGTLLAARFGLVAVLLWALAARHAARLARRDAAVALALGAACYSAQAGAYFAALERLDASLLAMLVYTFPAIVCIAAVVLGRERADGRRLAALALASAGLALVLAGAGTGRLDPVGTALGLGAAAVYAAYVLAGEGVARRMQPPLLAALVCTGAAVTLTAGSALAGDLRPGAVTAAGWGWLACLGVVSTVLAISLFFAGLSRVGPGTAAILSTAEPVVTVALAHLLFAEALGPLQLLGGALVVGAVLATRIPHRRELHDARIA